jgi:hypothetical protein
MPRPAAALLTSMPALETTRLHATDNCSLLSRYVSSLMKFLAIIARSRDHAVVDGEQVSASPLARPPGAAY